MGFEFQLFETFVGCHFDILFARGSFGGAHSLASRHFAWKPIFRGRHGQAFLLLGFGERSQDANLAIHFFLHKLVELVDADMFERTVLALADEPMKYFFEGVLFALLVGQVKGIARLLVEGGQGVR